MNNTNNTCLYLFVVGLLYAIAASHCLAGYDKNDTVINFNRPERPKIILRGTTEFVSADKHKLGTYVLRKTFYTKNDDGICAFFDVSVNGKDVAFVHVWQKSTLDRAVDFSIQMLELQSSLPLHALVHDMNTNADIGDFCLVEANGNHRSPCRWVRFVRDSVAVYIKINGDMMAGDALKIAKVVDNALINGF